jgi:hypothetical protein
MTKKELEIVAWVCLVFGYTFSFLHSYYVGGGVLLIGLAAWVWWIILRLKDKDKNNWRGGPPASV